MVLSSLPSCHGADLPDLAWVGPKPLDLSRFREVSNRPANKPSGGLWLSPAHEGGSDWAMYLEDVCPPESPYYFSFVELEPEARFLRVDSLEDFHAILNEYERTDGECDFLADFNMCSRFLEFERISRDWAGIHLTHRGQNVTRYPDRDKGILAVPSMYGWDIECVLVLQAAAVRQVDEAFSYPFAYLEDHDVFYA